MSKDVSLIHEQKTPDFGLQNGDIKHLELDIALLSQEK